MKLTKGDILGIVVGMLVAASMAACTVPLNLIGGVVVSLCFGSWCGVATMFMYEWYTDLK